MTAPAQNSHAFLLLEAAGFEFLIPVDQVHQIVEIEPAFLHIPKDLEDEESIGEATEPGGRRLEVVSLPILLTGKPSPPASGKSQAVEVGEEGKRVLLLPDRVGSIEEYLESDGLSIPPLVWGTGIPWCVRAWPGVAALRWQLDTVRLPSLRTSL